MACRLGLALLTLSWDKNWDSHSLVNGYPSFLSYDSVSSAKPRTATSHYLNQCWNIVNWILRNKLQWYFNRNSDIFIQENALENVVCEMASILSRPQCVKSPIWQSYSRLNSFFDSVYWHNGVLILKRTHAFYSRLKARKCLLLQKKRQCAKALVYNDTAFLVTLNNKDQISAVLTYCERHAFIAHCFSVYALRAF